MILRKRFIDTLPEKEQILNNAKAYVDEEINGAIDKWFSFDTMDFELMRRMGMKTTHLEENFREGEIATEDEIDEALSDQKALEANIDNVPAGSINCGEWRNNGHPCCSTRPGPPDFVEEGGYQYELVDSILQTRFVRDITRQAGQFN